MVERYYIERPNEATDCVYIIQYITEVLVAHANVTLISSQVDGVTFEYLLQLPGDLYLKFVGETYSAQYDQNNYRLTQYIGTMSDGVFTALNTQTTIWAGNGTISGVIIIFSDGKWFDFQVKAYRYVPYGSTNYSIGLRFLEIESLGGEVNYAYKAAVAAGDVYLASFPANTVVLNDGTGYAIQRCTAPSTTTVKNIPSTKSLLFPTLLAIAGRRHGDEEGQPILAGPMKVADQTPYWAVLPDGVTLTVYDEFFVNSQRYVWLGDCVLRSL